MGILSRLFSQQPQKDSKDYSFDGPGTFSLKVVGESYYQQNLSEICGGFTEEGVEQVVSAKLIHDDNNKYDDKAIRVEIYGKPVGHLSRSDARYYREKMREKGHGGLTAICKAKIAGGWRRDNNDSGNFGVTLDLPNEYCEGFEDQDNENIELDRLVFELDKSDNQELKQCKVGDWVNLWVNRDKSQVNVYRRGSVGGTGRIGLVPRSHLGMIANHLANGLDYKTEIISISSNGCRISCQLISKEETVRKKAEASKNAEVRLEKELSKKYTPQQPVTARIQLPKRHLLKEGQELFLKEQDKEYYIKNASNLVIVTFPPKTVTP